MQSQVRLSDQKLWLNIALEELQGQMWGRPELETFPAGPREKARRELSLSRKPGWLSGQETRFLPDCNYVKGNRALEATVQTKHSYLQLPPGRSKSLGLPKTTTRFKKKKKKLKKATGPFPRCVTLQSKTGQVAIFLCRTLNARFQVSSDVPARIFSEAPYFYRLR